MEVVGVVEVVEMESGGGGAEGGGGCVPPNFSTPSLTAFSI